MIFEVKDISYTYPGMAKKTLDHCSLTLKEGETLSILGPNGAGKSTLMNCMCGLLIPQEGEVHLCGRNVKKLSVKQIAKQVGYVQQNHTPVFGYTVLNFVMMGCAPNPGLFQKPSAKDQRRAMDALEELGIASLAEKPYTDISGGERQQVTIARAIVQNPKVILFDEPTAHLDFGKQLLILRMIKKMSEKGYAAVMTTHNPDHAILLGGMVAVVDQSGKIEKGPVEAIITEKRLTQIYQANLRLPYVREFGRTVCAAPGL